MLMLLMGAVVFDDIDSPHPVCQDDSPAINHDDPLMCDPQRRLTWCPEQREILIRLKVPLLPLRRC
jgi:hypothetical protein